MTGQHESSMEVESLDDIGSRSLVRQAGTINAGAARWPSAAPLPAAEYTVDSVDNVYFTNTSPIANVNNVYRSIPMMLINTESEENGYIFSVDGGISPNSDVARRAPGFTFGSNTSPTLSRQRSRENSSSCSILNFSVVKRLKTTGNY